jgi:hypothetical protein
MLIGLFPPGLAPDASQQLHAEIGAMLGAAGLSGQRRFQEFTIFRTREQLAAMAGGLGQQARGLKPASAEARQAAGMLSALERQDAVLELILNRLLAQSGNGASISLKTADGILIHGEAYVTYLQQQLRQGMIPSLEEMVRLFPASMDSPQGQQALSQWSSLLEQAGPVGAQRSLQLAFSLAMRTMEDMTLDLLSQMATLEPQSPESEQMEQRLLIVQKQADRFLDQLNQSLQQDPSHGAACCFG